LRVATTLEKGVAYKQPLKVAGANPSPIWGGSWATPKLGVGPDLGWLAGCPQPAF